MKMLTMVTGCLLLISALPTEAASPYENLKYALKEHRIITDLRTHCMLGESISDEKIRSVFLSNEKSHALILAASKALSAGDQQAYSGSIKQIACPEIK